MIMSANMARKMLSDDTGMTTYLSSEKGLKLFELVFHEITKAVKAKMSDVSIRLEGYPQLLLNDITVYLEKQGFETYLTVIDDSDRNDGNFELEIFWNEEPIDIEILCANSASLNNLILFLVKDEISFTYNSVNRSLLVRAVMDEIKAKVESYELEGRISFIDLSNIK